MFDDFTNVADVVLVLLDLVADTILDLIKDFLTDLSDLLTSEFELPVIGEILESPASTISRPASAESSP